MAELGIALGVGALVAGGAKLAADVDSLLSDGAETTFFPLPSVVAAGGKWWKTLQRDSLLELQQSTLDCSPNFVRRLAGEGPENFRLLLHSPAHGGCLLLAVAPHAHPLQQAMVLLRSVVRAARAGTLVDSEMAARAVQDLRPETVGWVSEATQQQASEPAPGSMAGKGSAGFATLLPDLHVKVLEFLVGNRCSIQEPRWSLDLIDARDLTRCSEVCVHWSEQVCTEGLWSPLLPWLPLFGSGLRPGPAREEEILSSCKPGALGTAVTSREVFLLMCMEGWRRSDLSYTCGTTKEIKAEDATINHGARLGAIAGGTVTQAVGSGAGALIGAAAGLVQAAKHRGVSCRESVPGGATAGFKAGSQYGIYPGCAAGYVCGTACGCAVVLGRCTARCAGRRAAAAVQATRVVASALDVTSGAPCGCRDCLQQGPGNGVRDSEIDPRLAYL